MMPGDPTSCMTVSMRSVWFISCASWYAQAEEQGAVWAADLKDLLLSMKQATQQARDQGKRGLDPMEVLDWERAFLRLLDEGDELTPGATAPPGTRGRIKQSAARNLLD